MVAATGIAAGLFGDLMMLYSVQHLAFGYHAGSLEAAVARASDVRRLVVLLTAGAFGGAAWYLLRRLTPGERTEIDDVVLGRRGTAVVPPVAGHLADLRDRHRDGRLHRPRERAQAARRGLREPAGRLGPLSPAQRKLLMACGGGAGLAAVYNVPLGGALFTAEIMIGTITLPVALPALACSGIATVTAWLYLPDHATYPACRPTISPCPCWCGRCWPGR